jgi:hypothetical protein
LNDALIDLVVEAGPEVELPSAVLVRRRSPEDLLRPRTELQDDDLAPDNARFDPWK